MKRYDIYSYYDNFYKDESPTGQYIKFTEAQASVKQAREALNIASRYMAINPYCSKEDEDHYDMACKMADEALAALDAFGEDK